MNTKRNLLSSLLRKERVDITSTHYQKNIKSFLIVFVLALISFTFWSLWSARLTYSLLFLSGAMTGSLLTISYYFYRHIQAAAVKGDTLILKSLSKKNKVTTLSSIQKIKTTSIFGVQFTDMIYNLDGLSNRAIIITLASRVPVNPEKSIKKAISFSLKEKANHKPGSVSAA